MEELIRQVTERTGISEEQARTAVQTVLGYLQNNLPAGISQQIGGLLGGAGGVGGGVAGGVGDIVGGLGGILGGGKKD
ncbi:MAG TPA: hypothetical protein VK421_08410 [Pyrinomonadaceae bacterium]|nr:hypothetical protein [Pyrinomonadaceae bacterium]